MHIGRSVELELQLGLSMSSLNTPVKNLEEIERCYAQCGIFSKQQKSLKHSPVEELELAFVVWF
jgi:hypothetical protein